MADRSKLLKSEVSKYKNIDPSAPHPDEFMGPTLGEIGYTSSSETSQLDALNMLMEKEQSTQAMADAVTAGQSQVALMDPAETVSPEEAPDVEGAMPLNEEGEQRAQGKSPNSKLGMILQMIGYGMAAGAAKDPGAAAMEIIKMTQSKIENELERQHEFKKLDVSHNMQLERDALERDFEREQQEGLYEHDFAKMDKEYELGRQQFDHEASVNYYYQSELDKANVNSQFKLQYYQGQMQNWLNELESARMDNRDLRKSESEFRQLMLTMSIDGQTAPSALQAAWNIYSPNGSGGTPEDFAELEREFIRKQSTELSEWDMYLKRFGFEQSIAIKNAATKPAWDPVSGAPIEPVFDRAEYGIRMKSLTDSLIMAMGGEENFRALSPAMHSAFTEYGMAQGELPPPVEWAIEGIAEFAGNQNPAAQAKLIEYQNGIMESSYPQHIKNKAAEYIQRILAVQSQAIDMNNAARQPARGATARGGLAPR